ncbi:MAG: NAD-dependent epimerase/dehydratase family protein [Terriglobia bacterium]
MGTEREGFIVGRDDVILITGATGFIGCKLVEILLEQGFRNVRCFARSSSKVAKLLAIADQYGDARLQIFPGNLLSLEDCVAATKDVALIFHLAAARGEKSFADAFMNSVVTTRNLLETCVRHGRLRRFQYSLRRYQARTCVWSRE